MLVEGLSLLVCLKTTKNVKLRVKFVVLISQNAVTASYLREDYHVANIMM